MAFKTLVGLFLMIMEAAHCTTVPVSDRLELLQHQLNSLRNEVYTTSCVQNANMTTMEEPRVAFTAYFAANTQDGLGRHATIKFDRVEANIGQAYKPLTGLFTCPYTGLYFFTHSILTLYQSHIETEIVLDGHPKAMVYAKAGLGRYDQGSNSIILHCNEGQHVWVRIMQSRGSSFHGNRYSQFSGYLMWKD